MIEWVNVVKNNRFRSKIKFICIFIDFIFIQKILIAHQMFDEKVILPEQLPVKEK
jgi:hypothetical protein